MPAEHPFAPFIRTLGKGKTGTRSLSREEACSAFGMILRGEARPEQVGAFLMLMRVKEESAAELAGFVDAVRAQLQPPAALAAALDWSSYAGKRKHLPWFVLAALLLAENGVRVFLHGSDGHTAGRLYTGQVCQALGLPVATDWTAVGEALDRTGLCFFPLQHWCKPLQDLIDLRAVLGLRSPVHTLARLVNPLRAACSLQSIFHPAYALHHQQAAALLGQPRALVIKGDGGEFERRPDAHCKLYLVEDGQLHTREWARHFAEPQPPETDLDPARLRAVWRGTGEDAYGQAAIVGTAALALHALGQAADEQAAYTLASTWWQARRRDRL